MKNCILINKILSTSQNTSNSATDFSHLVCVEIRDEVAYSHLSKHKFQNEIINSLLVLITLTFSTTVIKILDQKNAGYNLNSRIEYNLTYG